MADVAFSLLSQAMKVVLDDNMLRSTSLAYLFNHFSMCLDQLNVSLLKTILHSMYSCDASCFDDFHE
jgi:hypothetical protein